MKKCGIYKITSPSGKIYIGQSENIHRRFYQYKKLNCKQQWLLYKSFIKYGVDNHIFEIIVECNKEELNKNEEFYINQYNSYKKGLNCSLGGENKPSLLEEVKEKQSNTIKQKYKLGIATNARSKKVICINSLKEWKCLKDAWKELYINIYSYSYMKQMLNGKYNNKTTLIFKT